MRHNMKILGITSGSLAIVFIIVWALTGSHTTFLIWVGLILIALASLIGLLITGSNDYE